MDCSIIKPGAKVYLAAVEDSIKIGVSTDPATRMEELQRKTGKEFQVLGLMHGGFGAEKHLHHKFRDHRIYGEYFSRAPEIMAFISRMSSKSPCYACERDIGESNILQSALDETTRRVIEDAIAMVGNSNTDIAARIGMSRRNLYRVRRRLGV